MSRENPLAWQWQLLQLIGHPAGIAVDDAARKLDCTLRTIWRDLRVFHEGGFPLSGPQPCIGPYGLGQWPSLWERVEDWWSDAQSGLKVKRGVVEGERRWFRGVSGIPVTLFEQRLTTHPEGCRRDTRAASAPRRTRPGSHRM